MSSLIPLCPIHGLSLRDDYLCIVCHFELQGVKVQNYGRYEFETSTLPSNVSRDQWFVMGWKKRLQILKEAKIIDVEDEESQQNS